MTEVVILRLKLNTTVLKNIEINPLKMRMKRYLYMVWIRNLLKNKKNMPNGSRAKQIKEKRFPIQDCSNMQNKLESIMKMERLKLKEKGYLERQNQSKGILQWKRKKKLRVHFISLMQMVPVTQTSLSFEMPSNAQEYI